MSALHPLLRRTAGLLALGLALVVLLGSLCPRGWFVCLHGQSVALADTGHAADDGTCGEEDCCPDDGCLDLAISLVLDDQAAGAPVVVSLPSAVVVELLPDAVLGATTPVLPAPGRLADPPLPDLIRHVRLLV